MNARFRRICITAVLVVVGLLALLIVGYSQLMSYLQGDSFRQRMADGIRSASGAADVSIASNLSISGSRVSVEGASAAGMHSIREASASRISAEIDRTALLGRRLHIRKVSVEEASLLLSTGRKASQGADKAPAPAKGRTKANPQPPAPAPRKSALSLKGIEFDLFECQDADLKLEHNAGTYQLLGANITAKPAPRLGTGAWQIHAENARLHTPFPYLRESSIKSSTIVYHRDKVDVTDCRIMLTPGEMRLKAHYDLNKLRWSADMQINKGNVHRILNDDWKKRFSGELYGRLALSGKGSETTTGTGAFSVQNGVLEGLPFLSRIPVGNTYPYRSIELEKADCQIIFPYDSEKIKKAWLFDKINLRSRDGSSLVRGHVLIGTDRRLGGTLTIGVPRSIMVALPFAPEELTSKFFTATGDDEDYLWVNMNLSGTLDQPQEDLSIRIATITGNNLGQLLKEIPKVNASSLFDILLKQKKQQKEEVNESDTPAPAPEPAPRNLINEAAGAAGSLLQSLF